MSLGRWNLSSPTGDQTTLPAMEALSFNHWSSREVSRPSLQINVFLTEAVTTLIPTSQGNTVSIRT